MNDQDFQAYPTSHSISAKEKLHVWMFILEYCIIQTTRAWELEWSQLHGIFHKNHLWRLSTIYDAICEAEKISLQIADKKSSIPLNMRSWWNFDDRCGHYDSKLHANKSYWAGFGSVTTASPGILSSETIRLSLQSNLDKEATSRSNISGARKTE